MPYAYKNKYVAFAATIIDFVGFLLFYKKNIDIDKKLVKKIVVVKLDHLGDCFLCTPLFNYLKNNFTGCSIDILCMDSSKKIFEGNPNISNILTFNYWKNFRGGKNKAGFKDFLKVARVLRKNKYDLFIDARGQSIAGLLAFMSKSKYKVGFKNEEWGSFFYTKSTFYNRNEHETKRYKKLLGLLNISTDNWNLKIYPSNNEITKIDKLINEKIHRPILVISPGAGANYKIWPIENYIFLANKIDVNNIYDIVLLGGVEDIGLCTKIQKNVKNSVNLSGQLSVKESYYLLSKSAFWIGNDSFLAHVAGSFNINIIELMNGVVDKNRWAALGKNTTVVVGESRNHLCYYEGCKFPCPNMESISVSTIYEIFWQKIQKNNN